MFLQNFLNWVSIWTANNILNGEQRFERRTTFWTANNILNGEQQR